MEKIKKFVSFIKVSKAAENLTLKQQEIYDYVESHIDYEYDPEGEESIIGVGTESQQLV